MPTSGASELMRSLGLLVDGPVRWGAPVASRAPGIFVVELPGGADAPSIDLQALRRWLERVPSLTLDDQRPTPQVLQRRLARDWVAHEPIVFIGRANKGIGARLAAIYATNLGDTKPTSAGHWLKTLANLGDLRIWWAETGAHEEYQDALLEAVGATPWGNRTIAGTLRTEAEEALAKTKPMSAAAVAAARQAAPRKAGVRKPAVPKLGTKPAPEKAVLSKEGLERLTAELADLKDNQRPAIIARVASARELGDLKENGDYEYARKEQSFVEGRIQTLEHLLRTGVVMDAPVSGDAVHLGSTVEVEHEGERISYTIVGTAEANIGAGRLSNASPVGRALLGARAGDQVVVPLPGGAVNYRVVKVG
ncbi:MAG: transcription elongation factor GreA [Chloroflexota bacterium]